MYDDFKSLINLKSFEDVQNSWSEAKPFPHLVIDDFFKPELAKLLEQEFMDYDDARWSVYGNAIEIKKICNHWDRFPPNTYSVLEALNSKSFTEHLGLVLFDDASMLTSDPGLHGGGWHIHGKGGKLNTHLDYSLHPKLQMQRKLNLIVYLNSRWRSDWGGDLGLWSSCVDGGPGELEKSISPFFNRAVLFDTTCNSWHGLPEPISCPENQFRKSLAVYYLCDPPVGVDGRSKALFAPSSDQKGNPEILALIEKRAKLDSAPAVYENSETTSSVDQ